MARLVARKLLLIILLLPLLNVLGFGFARVFGTRQIAGQIGVGADEPADGFVQSYRAYLGRVAGGDWGAVQRTPIERYIVPLLRRSAVLNRTPWVALSAGLLVFAAMIGFTLLGEGLRRRLDVTRPRRRPWLRRSRDTRQRAGALPGVEV